MVKLFIMFMNHRNGYSRYIAIKEEKFVEVARFPRNADSKVENKYLPTKNGIFLAMLTFT